MRHCRPCFRGEGQVHVHPLPGAFGAQVSRIQELIGDQPAFLFVDPKGWKGAAMTYIAPLARRPGRDVMINVMFDHINRFKDAPIPFIRTQMQEFFGQPLPPRLSEEALMQSYRDQLKIDLRPAVRRGPHSAAPHPRADEIPLSGRRP